MQTQLNNPLGFTRFFGTLSGYDSRSATSNGVQNSIPVSLNNNVLFLADYLEKAKAKPSLITELEELLEDRAEWKEDGIEIEEVSVRSAIKFVENAIIANQLLSPHLEVHPDGEVAFTWRKANRGIISIAFNKHGVATWAAYFDHNQKRTFKGRFNVEDSISEIEKTIIQFVTDSPEDVHLAS